MKVYVYAIAKNEEKFVNRWLEWANEADGVFVLDTGSTDNTAKLLKTGGAFVTTKTIAPWRFDTARNLSLALVPKGENICVCADLDEVFEKGWKDKLCDCALKTKANLFSVRYVWSHDQKGGDGVAFYIKKTHARHGFTWRGAVHETLVPNGETSLLEATVDGFSIHHYPDLTKSRASYLPLLEQAVKEDPLNDRNAHYLGREYYFHGRYDDAIAALKNHLSLPTSLWEEERASSMRYLSRCHSALGDRKNAFKWAVRAVAEYPDSRESFIELAKLLFSLQDYDGVVWAANSALKIPHPSPSYINNPECFSSLSYDLLSIAYYHVGDIENALKSAEIALSLSPDDARIAENIAFFRKFFPIK